MEQARTHLEVNNLRAAIARIAGLSDNIVGFGPFGLGLDGILAWIPGAGALYSIGAGALLLALGWRARAPATALTQAVILLGVRSVLTLAGELVLPAIVPTELAVDLFRAHKWSADLMLKAIDGTLYIEGATDPSNPEYAQVLARIRAGEEQRRVVFLGS